MKLLVLNGPNLNLLGKREPGIYGSTSYAQLCKDLRFYGERYHITVDCYQSNHEGDLVDAIQNAQGEYDGIIINPGAYTHTSIAILDALRAVEIPTVEVHISNVNEREAFRKLSYVSLYAEKQFIGLGVQGYFYGIDHLREVYGG